MNGAELLAGALQAAEVETLFNLSGNQVMPLYGPLQDGGVRLVHARHEAAVVHMADAWSRLRERPCPVLLTAGPGHLNALGALYVARMAEAPVVMLSGHAELSNLGFGAFQEIDQVGVARRVAKAAWIARDPARLGDDLARAYRIANAGRPGPVHVSLPADVLRASIEGAQPPPARAFRPARRNALVAEVEAFIELVARARRPLLLAGPAMARGQRWNAVRGLADALGVPALPMESPRGANDPALGGVRTAFARSDLIVLLGRRADFSLGFGRPPLFAADVRFVQIEPDREALRPDLPIALTVRADPWQVVSQARRAARGGTGDRGWVEDVAAACQLGREGWNEIERSDQRPLHPLRVARAAGALLGAGDVFVSDGGEFGQWAQAGVGLRSPGPDRVINGPSGAIGGAIPFAIGARVARPEARVVALTGDGACGYHLAEVETAAREKLPFVLVVGNDGLWNAEVQIQRQIGGPELDCLKLGTDRYDRAADAFGGVGEHVTEPTELDQALARAVRSDRPTVLNVRISGLPAPTYRAGH